MSNYPNPFYAFVELWIGEVNVTLLPPQHIQQFTYIRKPMNSANSFIIALFDETALLVEAQLISGYSNIRFQYGYVNGSKSPVYSGYVQEYDIDFNPAGAILTMEGVSSSVSSFSNPKSATYTGMTIDQIVRQIAKEEGWVEGIIEPCEPVSDGTMTNKTWTRTNQPAQVFIVNDLIPYAKSSNTGDSNYILNFEDKADGTVVNFYPQAQVATLNESQTHNYEFRWGSGDVNSQVLDFNPDYSGTLCLMLGGGTVDSSTIDRISNCMVNMTFTSTDDPNRVVLADRSGYDYSGATRYIGGSAQSYDEMKKTAAYLWYINASYPVTAEMTIMGDPSINAFDTVSVVMLNKDGLPHHSSGIYCIKEVEDDIVGGSFTTKLILFRNAMEIGPVTADGVNINLVADLSINSVSDVFSNNALLGTSTSEASDLVNMAKSQLGYTEGSNGYTKYGDWYADDFENSDWCAMFVSWCAEQVGISNDVIPRTASTITFRNHYQNKGQWVASRYKGGSDYIPQAGDIIVFDWSTDEGGRDGEPDHVGIVVSCDGTTVYTIEGNTSNMVAERQYALTSADILGFGTPAYKVAATTGSGYYSKGSSNEETIYCFLTQVVGLNCAGACGVLANIYHESGFRTDALGDNGTSYGICQWHDTRYSSLMTWCSGNGYDYKTLEGQLYYLNHELNSGYTNVRDKLKSVSNDGAGAYQAGYDWCFYFERPANKAQRSVERGNLARDTYYPKYASYSPPPLASNNSTTVPTDYQINLHQLYLTNNACYTTGQSMTVKGIMVHSTGANNPNLKRYVGPDDGLLGTNQYGNHWNTAYPGGRSVCVHAFIGKLADGTIATYQTLPWDMKGWHAGGSANSGYIGFEICEDGLTDATYFEKVYNEAAGLCAYLCKMYGLNPQADGVLICHSEGCSRGIASNHGDVMHWFPEHGKSMDTFRADVASLM